MICSASLLMDDAILVIYLQLKYNPYNCLFVKELKATVIKNSDSLLTRIVNENCENLDGSQPILLNISGIIQKIPSIFLWPVKYDIKR